VADHGEVTVTSAATPGEIDIAVGGFDENIAVVSRLGGRCRERINEIVVGAIVGMDGHAAVTNVSEGKENVRDPELLRVVVPSGVA
jgi:hypothetical protein